MPQSNRLAHNIALAFITLACALTALYGGFFALAYPFGIFESLPPEARQDLFVAHFIGLWHGLGGWSLTLHTGAGAIALAATPFQLMPGLRRRAPSLHRWMGYIAFSAIAFSGMAGLFSATQAMGTWLTRLGFGCLAVAWLTTASLGLRAIRSQNVAVHRAWMIRTAALTMAAVTLRLEAPVLYSFLPVVEGYTVVAWLCWVPNLVVAELIVRLSPGVLGHAQSTIRRQPLA